MIIWSERSLLSPVRGLSRSPHSLYAALDRFQKVERVETFLRARPSLLFFKPFVSGGLVVAIGKKDANSSRCAA